MKTTFDLTCLITTISAAIVIVSLIMIISYQNLNVSHSDKKRKIKSLIWAIIFVFFTTIFIIGCKITHNITTDIKTRITEHVSMLCGDNNFESIDFSEISYSDILDNKVCTFYVVQKNRIVTLKVYYDNVRDEFIIYLPTEYDSIFKKV